MTADVKTAVAAHNGVGSRLLTLRFRGGVVPVTVVLLVGYVVARLLTTGILALAWLTFPDAAWAHERFPNDPGFLGFLNSWDSRWYEQVAVHGYPTELPRDSAGDVTYNTWAFLPVFPGIVRGLMMVTWLGFPIAGILVSVLFGAAATIMLHRVLAHQFSRTQALWGALFFAFGPLSFVLQQAYAESVFLFFLFVSLWFMQRRRYLEMIPFALLASFTHPGALALAAALAAQGIHRVWRRHPVPHREWITGVVAIGVIVAATLAWPLIASAATGVSTAYFETELAWWRSLFGAVIFVPFTPFFLLWGHLIGVWGIILVVLLVLGIAFWLTRRGARVYGADLWTFSAAYLAYLFAVFLPTGSLLRQLLVISPLLGHPALSRTPRRRAITLAVSIAFQPVVIVLLWVMYPP